MVRSIRIAIAVAAVCAVAVSASASAVASTPAPRGTLTAIEYTQLAESMAALKKFNHDKKATWKEGFAACDKVGQSTALLRSVRTNCNMALGLDQALYGFYTQFARCSAFQTTGTTTTTTPTGTTTTGTTTGTTTAGTTSGTTTSGATTDTTTTPGGLDTQQLQFLACLQPDYALISRASKTIYASQADLRQAVLSRHFVGRCLLTLAPTRAEIAVMKRLVSTTTQLAADVLQVSRVFSGALPASDLDTVQIAKDAAAESVVGAQLDRIKRPQNVAVCPHEKPTK
jgi:hypothetical protein